MRYKTYVKHEMILKRRRGEKKCLMYNENELDYNVV